MRSRLTRFLTAAGCLAAACGAFAAAPKVIFSNFHAPTSGVPGLAGAVFNPGTATQFDRPFVSPDGRMWILGAVADQAGVDLDVIIQGSGDTGAGAVLIVKEGDQIPGDPTVTYVSIRTQMGINNGGRIAFNADTGAATTADDIVVRADNVNPPSAFSIVAREGTGPVPGIAGQNYGSTNNASHILENGDVRFRSVLTPTTTKQALFSNTDPLTGTAMAETDVTVPAGQLVAPDQSLDNLTSDRFRSSGDGSHYIYHADLNGATTSDLVMVYDGRVVAQEGVVLPGSTFVSLVSAISGDAGSQQISPDGLCYSFRGSNADGIDWVRQVTSVIAATDQPITPGNTELYDDTPFSTTFFNNAVNDCCDVVIGGVTNNADLNANGVLVLNGELVVAREGDGVDVDGNGLLDDDAFLSVFNNDDSFLTADRRYYFHCDLRNGAAVSLGQALLVMQLPPRAATLIGDANCDGEVNILDINPFILAIGDPAQYALDFPCCPLANSDVNGDGNVDILDINPFIALLAGP
ncbi:hypothetical protein RAS1_25210 [Phycisphaerae bacterium RAS1]|nr:hypothetical protein RAS1_25210 [Phycisphaerae bacterium RAS1]